MIAGALQISEYCGYMNDLDKILDADITGNHLTFRTANGICRISDDRIELIRNINETTSFLTSGSFIIRFALLFAICAFFLYQQFITGFLGLQNLWIYAIPVSFVLLSIMGNLNTFLYRIRSLLFIGMFLWLVYLEYDRNNTFTAVIYLVFIVLLTLSFIRSNGYASDPAIPRKDILQVRFINSIPAITRAYFLVSFTNADGKERKRPILLPGILQHGESEKRHALQVMKSAGIIMQ